MAIDFYKMNEKIIISVLITGIVLMSGCVDTTLSSNENCEEKIKFRMWVCEFGEDFNAKHCSLDRRLCEDDDGYVVAENGSVNCMEKVCVPTSGASTTTTTSSSTTTLPIKITVCKYTFKKYMNTTGRCWVTLENTSCEPYREYPDYNWTCIECYTVTEEYYETMDRYDRMERCLVEEVYHKGHAWINGRWEYKREMMCVLEETTIMVISKPYSWRGDTC